jgi:hypothetical protein
MEIEIIQNVTPTKSFACKSPASAMDGMETTNNNENT